MNNIIRIAILGDSISQGLGRKLYNYSQELKANLEIMTKFKYEIKNFAYTGTTIKYANEIASNVEKFNPNIVISFYGNVDAMVRPKISGNPNYYSIIPKRYKKNGMLDPRPFFSSSKTRSFFEHIDSYFRYNLKKLLIKLQGTYCWVEIDEFCLEYSKFLNSIYDRNRIIFLISTVIVDEKYFPGTPESYEKYNYCIRKLASKHDAFFINLQEELKNYEWDEIFGNDHFHPNKNGYSIIAKYFSEVIYGKMYSSNYYEL